MWDMQACASVDVHTLRFALGSSLRARRVTGLAYILRLAELRVWKRGPKSNWGLFWELYECGV